MNSTRTSLLLAIATAALLSSPSLAQGGEAAGSAVPAAQPSADKQTTRPGRNHKRPAHTRQGDRKRPASNMSAEGRQLLAAAMRPGADAEEQRGKLRAAREKVNQLVAAEKLDVKALRQAMQDERKLVDSQHSRRQQALIDALQKMTPADRKAFADMSNAGHQRMNNMMRKHRQTRDGKQTPVAPATE